MQKPIYITKDGLEKLIEELKHLKDVKVPEVVQRIQEARNAGDISESTEYDYAKNDQAKIEGKISELEEIIKNAEITDGSGKKGEVSVGSKVRLHIEGDEEEYHIVGALEADPASKKISHESPIGAALLGKKVGEKIEIEAPIGTITYTILNIA